MFTLLITIILILAVLLILVILGQNSKGGVGAAFGGGATQIMGVTRTGNVLEKATWVLALSILVLSLASSAFYTSSPANQFSSPNIDSAKQQVVAPTFGGTENLLPAATEETPAQPDSTLGN
ncbi:preprotein translocase subunit SecG [Algoriphagus ratkowskyi]|uniref:Protein-export membrane protein SecG n=1 Tax=Algoriphagus ratkowskyi TaxID=57028 RepID=A0A2W7QMH1_9BACT|nr:preprotein translocase subunit SecG [Algoriphagus ratkowskyi]PZX49544.1 preprotein translocase subunit SecG [Algoriphagus ratkowskyi]TXD75411.1 preprotein translocase subunit SecG [Algoriphagus ratkowskyi]